MLFNFLSFADFTERDGVQLHSSSCRDLVHLSTAEQSSAVGVTSVSLGICWWASRLFPSLATGIAPLQRQNTQHCDLKEGRFILAYVSVSGRLALRHTPWWRGLVEESRSHHGDQEAGRGGDNLSQHHTPVALL